MKMHSSIFDLDAIESKWKRKYGKRLRRRRRAPLLRVCIFLSPLASASNERITHEEYGFSEWFRANNEFVVKKGKTYI